MGGGSRVGVGQGGGVCLVVVVVVLGLLVPPTAKGLLGSNVGGRG